MIAEIRKRRAEHQATYDRIKREQADVAEQLKLAGQAVREAKRAASAKSIAAVIASNSTATEDAAAAKQALVSAFEAETALKDRLSLLDRAAASVAKEMAGLPAQQKKAEDLFVAEALRAKKQEFRDGITACVAGVVAEELARGVSHQQLGMISAPLEKLLHVLLMPADGRWAMQRVYDEAKKIRERLLAEVAP